jgi:hypothetical protein
MKDASRGRASRFGFFLAATLAAGCGSGAHSFLDVGSDDGGGGGSGSNLALGSGADASTASLSVSASARSTPLCPGQCTTLSASAGGGKAPYALRWDHGLTTDGGPVTVCPSASTTYTVTATDSSGHSGGEISAATLTGSAKVTVEVSAAASCMDAGPPVLDGMCDSLADTFVAGDVGANPVPPWSYGWTATLGGTLTLYPTYYPVTPASGPFQGAGWPVLAQWSDPSNGEPTSANGWSVPPIPDITFNPTSAQVDPTLYNFAGNGWFQDPYQASMSPGEMGQYAVARWTARQAGTFGVLATFTGVCGHNGSKNATSDVHVRHDGADVPGGSGSLNMNGGGNAFTVMTNVMVAAGETIDFAIGNGGDGFLFDMTGIDAKVCAGTGVTAGR